MKQVLFFLSEIMPFLSHNHSPICFIARWGIGFTSCITNKEGASWTYDTLSVIDKIFSKTNHMHLTFCFLAAYTQLETPSEVAIAVRMLIAI